MFLVQDGMQWPNDINNCNDSEHYLEPYWIARYCSIITAFATGNNIPWKIQPLQVLSSLLTEWGE